MAKMWVFWVNFRPFFHKEIQSPSNPRPSKLAKNKTFIYMDIKRTIGKQGLIDNSERNQGLPF